MKMTLRSLLVLTGLALAAGQMLAEAQTAIVGALAKVISGAAPENRSIVSQPPITLVARAGTSLAQQVPLSAGVSVVGANLSAPENARPDPQDGASVAGSIAALQENERRQTVLELLKRLLAQQAVLTSGRDATGLVVPKRLTDLVGAREAQRLVAGQSNTRATVNAETLAQDAALAVTIAGVKRELVALSNRLVQIEANKSYKFERLELLQTASKGVIAGVTLFEARTALAEIEERRQDALVLIAQTEQRLAQAEHERAKLARHARAEFERDLLAVE